LEQQCPYQVLALSAALEPLQEIEHSAVAFEAADLNFLEAYFH